MKNISIFLTILIWVIPIFVACEEGPIVITPSYHDFGTVQDRFVIQKTFTIKNLGTKPTILISLPSTCGCIVGKPEPAILEPGQEGKFHTIFQPKGTRGEFVWDARIGTNLPEQPEITVKMRAYVLVTSILSDWLVNFKVFKKGTAKPITLWMAYNENPNFLIKSAKIDINGFDLKVEEMKEVEGFYPGIQRGYKIEIAPGKDIEYAENNGKLIIETDIPGHEKVELRDRKSVV